VIFLWCAVQRATTGFTLVSFSRTIAFLIPHLYRLPVGFTKAKALPRADKESIASNTHLFRLRLAATSVLFLIFATRSIARGSEVHANFYNN